MILPNPYVILGALGVVALVSFQSYRMGHNACQAAHNATELRAIEQFEAEKLKRIEAEKRREELSLELEALNNEQAVIVTQCLGTDRLRLINRVNQ